ncbi:hypothetical protein [Membranihabitans maritimus]|uniref:hypothetical protein n=1 Tax=Membranihabitans maritimus TaxID=2904244 RepID=UPI001F45309E|nr:hypothetical protein [Membranihabitans maritimus]
MSNKSKYLLKVMLFFFAFAYVNKVFSDSRNLYFETYYRDTVPEIIITEGRLDSLFESFPKDDPWEKTKDASALSWRESYTLNAFMDLYEATGDIKYLKEVESRGKRLLSHRDDKRGVVDGSGKSRPAWSMASKYVVATGILRNAQGDTVMVLQSTPSAYNNQTKIYVKPRPDQNTFDMTVVNEHFKREEHFENINLNSNSSRYIEKIVNDPLAPYSTRSGTYYEKSNLVRVEYVNPRIGEIMKQSIELDPIPLAFMGYIGIIYEPLIRFSEIVANNSDLDQFDSSSKLFIRSAEESYMDASQRLWVNGPNSNEGYYLMCEKGESMPADNVGQPFNYLGKHVSVELALYRITGKIDYRIRAEKMANLFKNRLEYDAQKDLYIWNYWYEPMTTVGWKPEDSISYNVKVFPGKARTEDISHGALDIALVMNAYSMGIEFSKKDVSRFANTLIKNVILENYIGVSRWVDGKGEYPGYFNALHRWLPLAKVVPDVYEHIEKAYFKRGEENFFFSANLLKWKTKLGYN